MTTRKHGKEKFEPLEESKTNVRNRDGALSTKINKTYHACSPRAGKNSSLSECELAYALGSENLDLNDVCTGERGPLCCCSVGLMAQCMRRLFVVTYVIVEYPIL
jgi:hypothetical protein